MLLAREVGRPSRQLSRSRQQRREVVAIRDGQPVKLRLMEFE